MVGAGGEQQLMVFALRAHGENELVALGLLHAVHSAAFQQFIQLARHCAERKSVHWHENVSSVRSNK